VIHLSFDSKRRGRGIGRVWAKYAVIGSCWSRNECLKGVVMCERRSAHHSCVLSGASSSDIASCPVNSTELMERRVMCGGRVSRVSSGNGLPSSLIVNPSMFVSSKCVILLGSAYGKLCIANRACSWPEKRESLVKPLGSTPIVFRGNTDPFAPPYWKL